MKEQISALMDGELEEGEIQALLRELRSNPEHRDCWEQYHLIGDALRHNLPPNLDRRFASCVSQAIAKEDIFSPDITPIKHKINRKRHTVMNPVSGFAIAASVAVVAYLGIGMVAVDEQLASPDLAGNMTQTAPETATLAPQTQTAALVPEAATPALPSVLSPPPSPEIPASGLRTVQGEQWQTLQPAVESRLKDYLHSHRNLIGTTAMSPAVVPPARLIVIQSGNE